MKRLSYKWKQILCLVLLAVMMVCATGCGKSSEETQEASEPDLNSPDTVIAVCPDMSADAMAKYPDAEFLITSDETTGLLAITSGQADCYIDQRATYDMAVANGISGLKVHSDGAVSDPGQIAVGISRVTEIPNAEALVNTFILEVKENGTLDEMYDRWMVNMDHNMPEIEPAENPEYTIVIGTTGLATPFTYIEGDELMGYDVELALRFAAWAGADIRFETYDWSGIITALETGKVDYAFSNLFISDEKKESVDFSTSYRTYEIIPFYLAEEEEEQISIFTEIKDSFTRTFITENRWKMVVRGLITTLEITLLSAVFGTILGFILYFLCSRKQKVISRIFNIYSSIMAGLPCVVILMIVYFVIFANVDISAILASVVAFSLMFSVAVAGVLNTGISAINVGQFEAAKALGFKKSESFRRVILPQAIPIMLPIYKAEFVSMMKLTSIVGYISIRDLTKAGDIIRARTYEAIFPLLAIALVYLLIAWTIIHLIQSVEIHVNPERREGRLPRGIDHAKPDPLPDSNDIDKGNGELIRFEHVSKSYGNVAPITDFSTVIRKGDVVSIIGPSGTGKSTLLRLTNGLEEKSGGRIVVLGQDVDSDKTDMCEIRKKVSMVFQSYNLFNHLTVIENLMLAPVHLNNKTPQEAYNAGMLLLNNMGLGEKALQLPTKLSGGQKQRVAIARALCMEPEILLFDEPTSALDPGMVGEILNVIRELARLGGTMLIVTHEMKLAREISTRVFYLDKGGLYEEGTAEEIFNTPKRDRTKAFVNNLRTMEIVISSPAFDFCDAAEKICAYTMKNRLSAEREEKLLECFRLMTHTSLVPENDTENRLHAFVEYNEKDDRLLLSFNRRGDSCDPFVNNDELKSKLEGACERVEYVYRDGRNYVHIDGIN